MISTPPTILCKLLNCLKKVYRGDGYYNYLNGIMLNNKLSDDDDYYYHHHNNDYCDCCSLLSDDDLNNNSKNNNNNKTTTTNNNNCCYYYNNYDNFQDCNNNYCYYYYYHNCGVLLYLIYHVSFNYYVSVVIFTCLLLLLLLLLLKTKRQEEVLLPSISNNNNNFSNTSCNNNNNNNTSSSSSSNKTSSKKRNVNCLLILSFFFFFNLITITHCYANELDKTEHFLDKLNLEQSIAAVFNKVAYGSTTKRSIPDNAYPITTLATPLLTTYRYSDGNDEWLRVDVKKNNLAGGGRSNSGSSSSSNSNFDFDDSGDNNDNDDLDNDDNNNNNKKDNNNYGRDLEKDHVLPTSAPAADILKNNNNKHYNNPNRYNNDRLRPDYHQPLDQQQHHQFSSVSESVTDVNGLLTSTLMTNLNGNLLRNVRPTKSMYSKDIPSYVPPSRAFFFTPPLPPEYQNPFADKPTLRGTNSDGFASRRPIPPPSLMPNKDRIPYRPDLPVGAADTAATNTVNIDKTHHVDQQRPNSNNGGNNENVSRKKTLNTPSQQNVRLGEFYRNLNDSAAGGGFEYEKNYAPEPSITRILSGSNGRQDDIHLPDILFHSVVTATPSIRNDQRKKMRKPVPVAPSVVILDTNDDNDNDRESIVKIQPVDNDDDNNNKKVIIDQMNEDERRRQNPTLLVESPNDDDIKNNNNNNNKKIDDDINNNNNNKNNNDNVATTQISDMLNLPNIKPKMNDSMVTAKVNSDEIWLICWNVHVYLVVFAYILLACYSIYKLIRYENDPHMFSKSYFLTIHLMLTIICVLRIFYLFYDPYNIRKSFNIFLYDFLHSFPLSLLATTFAVLILFLLKRTLTHLEVKTRPVFLVVFALLHIVLCFCLSIFEQFGHFDKASLIVCRPVFVLLTWSLGFSYLYLYHIIKNVLAKKSQNLSEICTQNISYASHITIAVALLFVLLGFVQLYALFFIKHDRFNHDEIKHHWILWGFELSVRFLEITIITLLAIVVSLKMSQREKQTGVNGGNTGNGNNGFPLFPCTTSDSSTDNIYPNNCNTNPNALNYSRNNSSEMILDNNSLSMGAVAAAGVPALPHHLRDGSNELNQQQQRQQHSSSTNLLLMKNQLLTNNNALVSNTTSSSSSQQQQQYPNNDLFCGDIKNNSSDRFERSQSTSSSSTTAALQPFNTGGGLSSSSRNSSTRKTSYDSAKYYTKPKYDFGNGSDNTSNKSDDFRGCGGSSNSGTERNIYSEPIDNNHLLQQQQQQHQYERTRHDFERSSEFDRRSSRNSSSNTSGRRSMGRSTRKNHHVGQQSQQQQHGSIGRNNMIHLGGIQTLPAHQLGDSMLVDEQGFVRFRHIHGSGGGDGDDCDNNDDDIDHNNIMMIINNKKLLSKKLQQQQQQAPTVSSQQPQQLNLLMNHNVGGNNHDLNNSHFSNGDAS